VIMCHVRREHASTICTICNPSVGSLAKMSQHGSCLHLVISHLDYCNAVLTGLTLAPFQRVLHTAARLILDLWSCDHVSAALRELHWLPIAQQIDYKLCLLVFKSSLGCAPVYITSMLKPATDVPSLATLSAAASGN